jgi:hypothetical protein
MRTIVIPPSWLSLQASTTAVGIDRWIVAETSARLAIIWGAWATVLVLARSRFESRQQVRKDVETA